jgi:Na+/phosphate symporter
MNDAVPTSRFMTWWHKVSTLIKALGLIGLTISTTAIVVWNVRKDRVEQLEHEVAVLKDSKDWKLPETLKSLNEISEKVRLQQEERNRLTNLAEVNDSLSKKTNEQQVEIDKLKESVDTLQIELKKSMVKASPVELSQGQATELIKNNITLGVKYIYTDHVQINLNNDSRDIEVGNKIEFPFANQKCVVILNQIKTVENKCLFLFSCYEK